MIFTSFSRPVLVSWLLVFASAATVQALEGTAGLAQPWLEEARQTGALTAKRSEQAWAPWGTTPKKRLGIRTCVGCDGSGLSPFRGDGIGFQRTCPACYGKEYHDYWVKE